MHFSLSVIFFADEDYETAVKNLNGKLYPDQLEGQSSAANSGRLDALII